MNRPIDLNPSADRSEVVRIKWPQIAGRVIRCEVMRFIAHPGIAQEPFDDGADGEHLKIFRPFHETPYAHEEQRNNG